MLRFSAALLAAFLCLGTAAADIVRVPTTAPCGPENEILGPLVEAIPMAEGLTGPGGSYGRAVILVNPETMDWFVIQWPKGLKGIACVMLGGDQFKPSAPVIKGKAS